MLARHPLKASPRCVTSSVAQPAPARTRTPLYLTPGLPPCTAALTVTSAAPAAAVPALVPAAALASAPLAAASLATSPIAAVSLSATPLRLPLRHPPP